MKQTALSVLRKVSERIVTFSLLEQQIINCMADIHMKSFFQLSEDRSDGPKKRSLYKNGVAKVFAHAE